MNEIIQEPKTRKKKLDLNETWTKCQSCLEPANLENLIRHKQPIKNSQGVVLPHAFTYFYFCGENCKGLWGMKT